MINKTVLRSMKRIKVNEKYNIADINLNHDNFDETALCFFFF